MPETPINEAGYPDLTPEQVAALPTEYEGSGGRRVIKDMAYPHLNNTIAKLEKAREAWMQFTTPVGDPPASPPFPQMQELLALRVERALRDNSPHESGTGEARRHTNQELREMGAIPIPAEQRVNPAVSDLDLLEGGE